jgi:hypothetical protein
VRAQLNGIGACLGLVALSACGSTPRPYAADVVPPPINQADYDKSFGYCSEQVAAGRTSNFRGEGGGGAAGGLVMAGTGAAVVAGGAAVASSSALAATYGTTAAVGGAAIAATGAILVLVAPLILMNNAEAEQAQQESRILSAMDVCLRSEGYVVQNWRPIGDDQRRGSLMLTPTRAASN